MVMRKSKNDSSAGCAGFLIVFALIFSVVLFSPGIILASFIDLVVPMSLGPLWGTTILACLLLLANLYFRDKEKYLSNYMIVSLISVVAIVVYTLFNSDNIIYSTVMKLYPFVEEILMNQ